MENICFFGMFIAQNIFCFILIITPVHLHSILVFNLLVFCDDTNICVTFTHIFSYSIANIPILMSYEVCTSIIFQEKLTN